MVGRAYKRESGATTIFVAYDPETRDQAPVRFASAAARFATAPLVVASVYTRGTQQVDGASGELARLHEELASQSGVAEVRPRVVHGSTAADVARELRRIVDDEHADLVVVGASRRGAIGRFAPGATAQRMINGCHRPVVVVPHGHEPPARLATIGVAFVPTAEGHRALRVAAAIARIAGAKLRVLTVIKPTLGADASAGPAKEAAERERAELESTIAAATAELGHGIRIELEVFTDDPASALLSVSGHLDLLVMGSRAYGPMLGVLLGSVSRGVTAMAGCPVLVVPRASAAVPALQRLDDTGGARVINGRRLNDARKQAAGGFAGPVPPSASVGRFAGSPRRRDQGTGSFAGDPDRQRQGSFGDVDLNVTTYDETDAVPLCANAAATLDKGARVA
jgi:nucleotide-binding universal stress UspA family protein